MVAWPYAWHFPGGKGVVKKVPGTGVQLFFFSGNTPGGEGGYKKIHAKFVSGPQKLKFSQLYPTSLGLEGARRIFFKTTIDVSANMGGICVSGHKDPRSLPAAVPWPLISGPKSGRKCYITRAFSRLPNKGNKIKAQKSNKNQKEKISIVSHTLLVIMEIASPRR